MIKHASVCAWLCCSLMTATAYAGPIELFNDASIDQAHTEHMIAPYQWGNAGMLVSADAGKSYRLLCTDAISPTIHSNQLTTLTWGGSIYVATFNGLWRGDAAGCNFQSLPELKDHYVAGVAGDPVDPTRVYAVTGDPDPQTNGVYLSEGGGAFSPLGLQVSGFFTNLHVVKQGTGRRFYATAVTFGAQSTQPQFLVRVSDDDATTWTDNAFPIDQFGAKDSSADFEVLAVDPTDPDHIVAGIVRDQMPDTLLDNPSKGEPGSWRMLAQPSVLDAVAFAPDGTLYFGDDDQMSPGLFAVDKGATEPRKLSDQWKVSCLQYDGAHQRMFACNDYRFGTVDLTSGAFTALVDARCADQLVECPGAAMQPRDACQQQLVNSYCGSSHYPAAPLCSSYPPDAASASIISDLDYTCKAGLTVPKPATGDSMGTAGTSAGPTAVSSAGTAAMSGAAGSPVKGAAGTNSTAMNAAGSGAAPMAVAGTAAPPSEPTKHSGCSSIPGPVSSTPVGLGWMLVGVLVLVQRRQRTKRQ